jgi:hypothetical protein
MANVPPRVGDSRIDAPTQEAGIANAPRDADEPSL